MGLQYSLALLNRFHILARILSPSMVLLIVSIIFLALGILLHIFQPHSELKVSDLKIRKRKYVLLVLQWCSINLGASKNYYDLKIYYYRNNKFGGSYQYWNGQISIYVYDDLRLTDLVTVVIHEYMHHLQFSKSRVPKSNVEKDYLKKSEDRGYWKNSYEVAARRTANKCRYKCFEWVMSEIGRMSSRSTN